MLPPDPFIECDETWVRFEWPAFRVLTAEKQRLRVNCEVYHGAFDVCFEVVMTCAVPPTIDRCRM